MRIATSRIAYRICPSSCQTKYIAKAKNGRNTLGQKHSAMSTI